MRKPVALVSFAQTELQLQTLVIGTLVLLQPPLVLAARFAHRAHCVCRTYFVGRRHFGLNFHQSVYACWCRLLAEKEERGRYKAYEDVIT
jgi:hypothetical protein